MVRTTIACSFCRNIKVKCVHQGTPPCRNCVKKGRTQIGQCMLTGPERRKSRTTDTVAAAAQRPSRRCSSPDDRTERPRRGSPTIASSVVETAVSVFTRKFPEFRFLHAPTFLKAIRSLDTPGSDGSSKQDDQSQTPLRRLCASILALCVPMMQGAAVPATAETYAAYARECISVAEHPDLLTVQALVVLAMYEWGSGNGYQAWMYSGMAIRMMQSLGVTRPIPCLAGVPREIYNRTMWACFVMDRLAFCGKAQPFMLSFASMGTHWPVAEDDFAFGQQSTKLHWTDEEQGSLEHMGSNMTNYYGILVRGFDIWARILQWVVDGGRRSPGMCLPENHPWVRGSRWRLFYDELQAWRNGQETRLQYPQASVEGHSALGQAEQFAYINLIYYISLLFLGREYIKFLPTPDCEPSSPVDPPLLLLQAPCGWWDERASELFTSSARIATLLEELNDTNASLYTPFTGLCGFSAATMNLYITFFPRMNLGRSQRTFEIASSNLGFLDRFRKIWTVGEGWWVTIRHCKLLYEHLSGNNRSELQGRTREDYAALEFSINDVRGRPPSRQIWIPRGRDSNPQNLPDDSGDQLTVGTPSQQGHPDAQEAVTPNVGIGDDLDWHLMCQLWSPQQTFPFTVPATCFNQDVLTENMEPLY